MTGTTYAIIATLFFILSFGSFLIAHCKDCEWDWNEVAGAFILCAFMAFFWPLATILGMVVLIFVMCSE